MMAIAIQFIGLTIRKVRIPFAIGAETFDAGKIRFGFNRSHNILLLELRVMHHLNAERSKMHLRIDRIQMLILIVRNRNNHCGK